MKLLIFGDNHGDLESFLSVLKKAKEADLIISLGDFTYFGEQIEEIMKLIATFPKKVILLHGNHEDKTMVKFLAQELENIQFSHKEFISLGEYDIITYGGGGFATIDEEFEAFAQNVKKKIRDPAKTILLLHAPPHNTKLDIPFAKYHSGTISFRKFIEEVQPLAAFSGHVHEGEGLSDYINKTILHNPGPYGVLIDVDELYQQRKAKKKVKIKAHPKG